MSQVEVYDAEESIIGLWLEGKNATEISKRTQVQRKDVNAIVRRYKEAMRNDPESAEVARDMLNKMVVHYDRLISESYKILDDLKDETFGTSVANQMNSVLRSIADFEAKRVDLLQKAGVLDANEMGDELARMEEQKAIIIDILQNDLCPACKKNTAAKLSQVTGRAEVISID